MPISERDWAREPLPAERIESEKPKISDEALDEYELTMTGDGYRIERADERPQLGWLDVLFWIVLLVLARRFG